MPAYRSRTTTHGRNMAGARGLWRATGMKDADFGKPIIAVVNSFTQFVPGHVHLKDLGQLVAREIETAGGVAKEFNTIAVDDGIAMGHDGMLYSLPSRELIADSVEYMVNAHCADAMVCISNCDKITPGMLMAAMRLNIPAVFVSGGPMEAGKVKLSTGGVKAGDLIDIMVAAADDRVPEADVKAYEQNACPTCGSCSGMFTANSMNCLTEALGLSLPGNGSTLATHADRKRLFQEAGHLIVDLARRYYDRNDATVLPRSIASKAAFENAMTLDIAMGGSTNTVLHILAAAYEGGIDFTLADVDRLSRQVPVLCKVAPSVPNVHMEDVHRAGGIMAILGQLDRGGLINRDQPTVHTPTLGDALDRWDVSRTNSDSVRQFFRAAPGGVPTQTAFSQSARWEDLDLDRQTGAIRNVGHAFSRDGGLAVLKGNLSTDGCVVKTAGVDDSILVFFWPRRCVRKPGRSGRRHPRRQGQGRRCGGHPLRRAARRAGHAGNAIPYELSQIEGVGQSLRAANRWPLLGRQRGPLHWSRLARSERGRHDRTGRRGRPHRDRHPQSKHHARGRHGRTGRSPPRTRKARIQTVAASQARGLNGAARLCGLHHQRRERCGADRAVAPKSTAPWNVRLGVKLRCNWAAWPCPL